MAQPGCGTISGVFAPGEMVRQKGLSYAATAASGFIRTPLQLAAGMHMLIFTTGRGAPYGLAAVPVIEEAARSDLARRWRGHLIQ